MSRAWVDAQRFCANPPPFAGFQRKGDPGRVVIGLRIATTTGPMACSRWRFPRVLSSRRCTTRRKRERAGLAWGLGAYQFTRYRASDRRPARLALGDKQDG